MDGLRDALSREAVGIATLALGLFFSAAFFTGRGAFLGEAGLFVARNLLGEAGLALAPLAALGGLLLLLDRLPGRAVVGTALLLAGVATTFGAAMPRRLLFEAEAYPDAGGAVGSAVYYTVDLVGGSIGTVLALAFLYVLGLSLVTGISFAAALTATRDGVIHLAEHARSFGQNLRESLRDGREPRQDKPPAKRERQAARSEEAEVRDLH